MQLFILILGPLNLLENDFCMVIAPHHVGLDLDTDHLAQPIIYG